MFKQWLSLSLLSFSLSLLPGCDDSDNSNDTGDSSTSSESGAGESGSGGDSETGDGTEAGGDGESSDSGETGSDEEGDTEDSIEIDPDLLAHCENKICPKTKECSPDDYDEECPMDCGEDFSDLVATADDGKMDMCKKALLEYLDCMVEPACEDFIKEVEAYDDETASPNCATQQSATTDACGGL